MTELIVELDPGICQKYYPLLEATKVFQVILDQPGMYIAGITVCKKWHSYLTSKPREKIGRAHV